MNSTHAIAARSAPALLAPGQLCRLDGLAGWHVHVQSGRLWLTEPGDACDHFVLAGRSHCLRQNEAVLIENDRAEPAVLIWSPATAEPQASSEPMMTSER